MKKQTYKQKRLAKVWIIIGALSLVAIGIAIILKVFNDNVIFYYSPSELAGHQVLIDKHRAFRVGGLVVKNSIKPSHDNSALTFVITDYQADLQIYYKGITPNLFKEGQGVIALGNLKLDGIFEAKELLAKHDENYIPKEITDSIKPAKK